jgi:zinc transport system permease protein
MNNFIELLIFSISAFTVSASFSVVIPPLGASLHIRNEILYALALPSLAGAMIILGAAAGIDPENNIALYSFSIIAMYFAVSFLGYIRLHETARQTALASVFVGSNVLSQLLMSISSRAESHLKYLISGDMLSIGRNEIFVSSAVVSLAAAAAFIFKRAVFSYCIDEEHMRLRVNNFAVFSFLYRLVAVALITCSVIFIGPLLTSALLVFPALTADRGKGSIGIYFLTSSGIGLSGVIAGFSAGLMLDIPPAYTASAAILIAGSLHKLSALFSLSSRKL